MCFRFPTATWRPTGHHVVEISLNSSYSGVPTAISVPISISFSLGIMLQQDKRSPHEPAMK